MRRAARETKPGRLFERKAETMPDQRTDYTISGDQLRQWMDFNGWSYATLADELGVTRRTVVRWRNMDAIPRLAALAIAALPPRPQ